MTEFKSNNHIRSFSWKIIIPVILTIAAFIISIYIIFIPSLENNLIKQKKLMIRELTQAAWSILQEYHQEEVLGLITSEEARTQALQVIRMLRYGDYSKDYFWITDMKPVMVMHPYRPELDGTDLKEFRDPGGKKLFVESVAVVEKNNEGFVDYYWQWKDDSTRTVPKLSFVKGFKPWGWILGTGIYMEDVKDEISKLKKNLVLVSLFIILLISGILFYILRTSLIIESGRRRAEARLKESRERYRSLVEASKEGTLLTLDGKINYVNPYFLDLFGYQPEDLTGRDPEELFDPADKETLEAYRDFLGRESGFIKLEARWKNHNSNSEPVLLSISRISIAEKKGCIFTVKELSAHDKLAQQIDELEEELQTSMLFMNQPVRLLARRPAECLMNTTIRSCAELMSRKNQNGILVSGSGGEYIGIVTDHDLRLRVLARGKDFNDPVYTIMSSPIVSIADNALLFEALLSLRENDVTHIAIADASGQLTGLISHEELLQVQQNTTDQDNALIYQDSLPQKEKADNEYFLTIGQMVNDWLDQAGYRYFPGKIMAGNPRWCQPLSQWKEDFKNWIINAEPEAVMDAGIFFDFRLVFGEPSLTISLSSIKWLTKR